MKSLRKGTIKWPGHLIRNSDDEVYPLDPPQEAETGVPECEQIDEEAEQNQG